MSVLGGGEEEERNRSSDHFGLFREQIRRRAVGERETGASLLRSREKVFKRDQDQSPNGRHSLRWILLSF